jgi:hypothetical protein
MLGLNSASGIEIHFPSTIRASKLEAISVTLFILSRTQSGSENIVGGPNLSPQPHSFASVEFERSFDGGPSAVCLKQQHSKDPVSFDTNHAHLQIGLSV